MKMIRVWLNDGAGGRKSVDAELVKENALTIVVRLPDGNVVKRNKERDIAAFRSYSDSIPTFVKEATNEIRGERKGVV